MKIRVEAKEEIRQKRGWVFKQGQWHASGFVLLFGVRVCEMLLFQRTVST